MCRSHTRCRVRSVLTRLWRSTAPGLVMAITGARFTGVSCNVIMKQCDLSPVTCTLGLVPSSHSFYLKLCSWHHATLALVAPKPGTHGGGAGERNFFPLTPQGTPVCVNQVHDSVHYEYLRYEEEDLQPGLLVGSSTTASTMNILYEPCTSFFRETTMSPFLPIQV